MRTGSARIGIGIGIPSRYRADTEEPTRPSVADPPPVRELWMAAHTDIRHTPRIRAVTDFLASTIRTAAERLNPA